MSIKRLGKRTSNTCVSSTPSKIPYVGFSPVRLQTDIHPRPSEKENWLKRKTRIRQSSRPLIRGQSPDVSLLWPERARSGGGRIGTSRSRGPWLANGLCCPVGSRLTMTSSETLTSSRRLICFVQAGLCPAVLSGLEMRGSPICSVCLSLRAAIRTPADQTAACGCCFTVCAGLRPSVRGSASAKSPHADSREVV